MYIKLHELLDLINSFPIKLIVNDETKVIVDKTAVDKTYLNYEVIKVSVGKDAVIVIEAKKYEHTADENYSFETGV